MTEHHCMFCFAFGRLKVQILAQRMFICVLTEAFLSRYRQVLEYCLKVDNDLIILCYG
jgi:hypothetical protein